MPNRYMTILVECPYRLHDPWETQVDGARTIGYVALDIAEGNGYPSGRYTLCQPSRDGYVDLGESSLIADVLKDGDSVVLGRVEGRVS